MDLLLERAGFFVCNQKNKMIRRAVERELNEIKMKIHKNTNWWWRSNFLQIREEK